MDAMTATEHEPAAGSQVVAAVPPPTVRDQMRERAARPLPVREIPSGTPSWEQILVAAGLDRESRELSPAERWMVDRRASRS